MESSGPVWSNGGKKNRTAAAAPATIESMPGPKPPNAALIAAAAKSVT